MLASDWSAQIFARLRLVGVPGALLVRAGRWARVELCSGGRRGIPGAVNQQQLAGRGNWEKLSSEYFWFLTRLAAGGE